MDQLAHPTQKSKYGFKYSQKGKVRDSSGDPQNMSILTMEVFGKKALLLSMTCGADLFFKLNREVLSSPTPKKTQSLPSSIVIPIPMMTFLIQLSILVIMLVMS